MTSVTPKPRTGPEASRNSSPAASSVVTLESAMALKALEKPLSSAGQQALAARGGVLLPGALEDEHVGVDRQTGGQQQTTEARQGQRRAERDQRAVGDQAVRRERDGGEEADEAVDDDQEDRGQA